MPDNVGKKLKELERLEAQIKTQRDEVRATNRAIWKLRWAIVDELRAERSA